jgi:thioredoxin 1
MRVDVLRAPGCAKCQRELPALKAAALAAEPSLEWRELDIASEIDYAVELGVMRPPAVAIDGSLAFDTLPAPKALAAAIREHGSRR